MRVERIPMFLIWKEVELIVLKSSLKAEGLFFKKKKKNMQRGTSTFHLNRVPATRLGNQANPGSCQGN